MLLLYYYFHRNENKFERTNWIRNNMMWMSKLTNMISLHRSLHKIYVIQIGSEYIKYPKVFSFNGKVMIFPSSNQPWSMIFCPHLYLYTCNFEHSIDAMKIHNSKYVMLFLFIRLTVVEIFIIFSFKSQKYTRLAGYHNTM